MARGDVEIRVGVKDDASKPLDKVNSKLGGLAKGAGAAGAAVVAAGAAIAKANSYVTDFAKDISSLGDRLAKSADRLGLTTDELQKLEFAFDRTGVGAEKGTQAFTIFTRNLGNARQGVGEAKDALALLSQVVGEDLTDSTLTSDQAFRKIADGIKGIEDPTLKASTAQKIFGRGAADMINLLNEGSIGIDAYGKKLEDLGGVIDEKALRKSEEYQDSLTNLQKTLDSFKSDVFLGFADEIIRATSSLADLTGNKDLVDGLGALGRTVVETAEFWLNAAVKIAEGIAKVSEWVGIQDGSPFRSYEEEIKKQKRLIESLESDRRNTGNFEKRSDLANQIEQAEKQLKGLEATQARLNEIAKNKRAKGASIGSNGNPPPAPKPPSEKATPSAKMSRGEFEELAHQFDIDVEQMKEIYGKNIVEAWEYLEDLRIEQEWVNEEERQKLFQEAFKQEVKQKEAAQEQFAKMNDEYNNQQLADVQKQLETERMLKQRQLESFNNSASAVVATAQGMANLVEGEAGRVLNAFANMMQSIMSIVNSAASGNLGGIIAGGFGLLGSAMGMASKPSRGAVSSGSQQAVVSPTTNITVNTQRLTPRDLAEIQAKASRTSAPRSAYAY